VANAIFPFINVFVLFLNFISPIRLNKRELFPDATLRLFLFYLFILFLKKKDIKIKFLGKLIINFIKFCYFNINFKQSPKGKIYKK
jgi:hypothetical protein